MAGPERSPTAVRANRENEQLQRRLKNGQPVPYWDLKTINDMHRRKPGHGMLRSQEGFIQFDVPNPRQYKKVKHSL